MRNIIPSLAYVAIQFVSVVVVVVCVRVGGVVAAALALSLSGALMDAWGEATGLLRRGCGAPGRGGGTGDGS